MKLEVGMYVRTKDGKIGKYFGEKAYEPNKICIWTETTKEGIKVTPVIDKNTIVKASYNIIDILEEGDYANGYYVSKIWEKDEITHYVNETPIKRKEREIVIQAPSYGGIEILKNKNIKSVITHEQMERMTYKVEK